MPDIIKDPEERKAHNKRLVEDYKKEQGIATSEEISVFSNILKCAVVIGVSAFLTYLSKALTDAVLPTNQSNFPTIR